MVQSLQASFSSLMGQYSRRPIQLAHFKFGTKTRYLSDIRIGVIDGLENEYSPWIESWGTLKDNTNIDNVINGGSLEVRSSTLTIINSPESRSFIKEIYEQGIENIKVDLYQWFYGLLGSEKVLIDSFVCQDPIELSESSMLLSIDIVSVIMTNNPYLWTRSSGQPIYDIVVGKAVQAPLIDLQTSRSTTLTEEIPGPLDNSPTGLYIIKNGTGFPSSGNIFIDSELMTYDAISASGINITARGVNNTTKNIHYAGALLTIPNANYDYAICAGPVASAENLKGNDETYQNEYTLMLNQDPAIVRFISRPPWLKVETSSGGSVQPDDVTLAENYGIAYEVNIGDEAQDVGSPEAINVESGSASMNIHSVLSGADKTTNNFGGTYESYWGDGASESIGPEHINDSSSDVQMHISSYVDGGDKSIPKTSNTVWGPWNTGSCSSDMTVLCLSGNKLGIYGSNSSNKVTNAGVEGGYSILLQEDLSSLGDFQSCDVAIKFSFCRVRNSHAQVEIYHNNAGSYSKQIEYEMYSNTDSYVNMQDANTTVQLGTLSISSWEDLYSAGVTILYRNVEGFLGGTYNPDGYVDVWHIEFTIYYFEHASTETYPWQEDVSHYNYDHSGIGTLKKVTVQVALKSSSENTDCTRKIVKRSDNDMANDVTLETFSDTSGYVTFGPYDLNITDWGELANMRVGVFSQIAENPEDTTRVLNTDVAWVLWTLVYEPTFTAYEPWQELVSHYNIDHSGLGTIGTVKATVKLGSTSDCDKTIKIIERYTSTAGGTVLQTITPTEAQEYGPYTLSNIDTWAKLESARIGVLQQITGPNDPESDRSLTTSFYYVKWSITYTPDPIYMPDEETIVYADEVTIDVISSLGEDPTPPQVIRHMIEAHSPVGEYIDTSSFDAAHTKYDDENYYLNGMMDGDIRLHDALRKVLKEGMLRLLFNSGKIKVITYFDAIDNTVDEVIELDQVFLRSRTRSNQPIDQIKNDITIMYDRSLTDSNTYNGKYNVTDQSSIAKFTSQESILNYDFINDSTIAELIGDRLLELHSSPISLYGVSVFMPTGFLLEKGDAVTVKSFLDPSKLIFGTIISIDRVFGQGKTQKINKYKITIFGEIIDGPIQAGISEPVLISDTESEEAKLSVNVNEPVKTTEKSINFIIPFVGSYDEDLL